MAPAESVDSPHLAPRSPAEDAESLPAVAGAPASGDGGAAAIIDQVFLLEGAELKQPGGSPKEQGMLVAGAVSHVRAGASFGDGAEVRMTSGGWMKQRCFMWRVAVLPCLSGWIALLLCLLAFALLSQLSGFPPQQEPPLSHYALSPGRMISVPPPRGGGIASSYLPDKLPTPPHTAPALTTPVGFVCFPRRAECRGTDSSSDLGSICTCQGR